VRGPRFPILVILTSFVLILTVLAFFVRVDGLLGIQWILIRWAVTIAAFAVILGFLNVIAVHIGKLVSRASGWLYSLVLIVSAIAVLAFGLGGLISHPEEGLWGPIMKPVFVWLIVPLQAAAAALLPFILTFAAYRMLRMDRQKGAIIFLISALIMLVSWLPLSGQGEVLQTVRETWLAWLAIPGLRAVLIGVALGVSMTALRLIMGIDRPQG
jgi:hypothetical protein